MAFIIDAQKQYVISGKVMMVLHAINEVLNDRYADNKSLDEDKLYFYLGMLFDLILENRTDNILQLPDDQKFKIRNNNWG